MFLYCFKKTIEHFATSCKHFARSCKKENVSYVQQVPEIIFDRFLVLCFAEADLQNYMFCQALERQKDFRDPRSSQMLKERERIFVPPLKQKEYDQGPELVTFRSTTCIDRLDTVEETSQWQGPAELSTT